MANKTNSMAHTKWMCKYQIVFTPKYRRKAIYNQYKVSIRDIIKQLCAYKCDKTVIRLWSESENSANDFLSY